MIEELRITPVAGLDALNNVQTARVERREQTRQAGDLVLWNVAPIVYNNVVSVVLHQGEPQKITKHKLKISGINEVVCMAP